MAKQHCVDLDAMEQIIYRSSYNIYSAHFLRKI